MLIAKGTHTFDKLLGRRINAALTLDGLHDNGAGLIGEQCLHAVQIIKLRESDIRNQRSEGLLVVERAPRLLPWKECFMAMIS